MYSSTLPSTSVLDGVGVQRHGPAVLPSGRTGTNSVGGWVGHRAGLEGRVQKISPPTEFDPLGRPACSESLHRLRYPGPV